MEVPFRVLKPRCVPQGAPAKVPPKISFPESPAENCDSSPNLPAGDGPRGGCGSRQRNPEVGGARVAVPARARPARRPITVFGPR